MRKLSDKYYKYLQYVQLHKETKQTDVTVLLITAPRVTKQLWQYKKNNTMTQLNINYKDDHSSTNGNLSVTMETDTIRQFMKQLDNSTICETINETIYETIMR